jgi:uncharacterized protein (DUF2147 family)
MDLREAAMKPIYLLAGLMVLSSPAYAGSSISFSVGGHRIHIEASPHCRSTSCASVSVSGIYDSRRKRDRFEDDDATAAKPASPAPQLISPPSRTVDVSAPPAVYKPAASVTQTVDAPPPPPPLQRVAIPLPPPPPSPVPAAAPQVSRVSHEVEQEVADTPVGDWQTEGKGAVRIVRCGNALCGYILNSSSDDRGEAVLINMKVKTDTRWTGSVYSHDSGDTFYGTMDLKAPNTLRVEACALGRFYCSGNNWSRISTKAGSLMTSRQDSVGPRS